MKWCVAFSAPNMAALVQERALNRLSLDIYIPMMHFSHPGTLRHREVNGDRPVFPGYMFVAQTENWQDLPAVDGFRGFLTRREEVISIDNSVIDEIKLKVERGDYERALDSVKIYDVGAPVQVETGPLHGRFGVIVKIKRADWAFVQLDTVSGKPVEIQRKNLLLI